MSMRSFCNDQQIKEIYARHLRITNEEEEIIDGNYSS